MIASGFLMPAPAHLRRQAVDLARRRRRDLGRLQRRLAAFVGDGDMRQRVDQLAG